MLRPLLPLILAGFVGIGLWAFRRLPGPYAVLFVVLGGQLFLPEVQTTAATASTPEAITLPLVKLAKTNVIAYALLAGSLLFDRRRWGQVYPRWYDVPVAVWCLAPFISSLDNDIGLYDAVGAAVQTTMTWGVPYWLGRLYLGTRDGLRAWCGAVILGAAVYVPLCLVELRLSPQWHNWVYGFHAADFVHAMRDGGFRPSVFMENGLALSLYLASAAVAAFWLWRCGTYRAFVVRPEWPQLSLGLLTLVLAVVLTACRSLGAQVLGAGGAATLVLCRATRWSLPLWALIVVPPAYIAARYTHVWHGDDLVAWVRTNVSEARGDSLWTRLDNEKRLVVKAQERPVFGWGGWGRSRIYDDFGHDTVLTDSLWVVTLGVTGLFGLTALLATTLLPPARLLWHLPPRLWRTPADAPPAAVLVILLLVVIDQLVNAQLNAAYMVALGAAAGAASGLATPQVAVSQPEYAGAGV